MPRSSERADALYTNAQNEFLNGLKDQPKAQKEFTYRAAQVKQGVLFDVYKFDFGKRTCSTRPRSTSTLPRRRMSLPPILAFSSRSVNLSPR